MTTYSLQFNEGDGERFIIVIQSGQPDIVVDEDLVAGPTGANSSPTPAGLDRAIHLCRPYEYWLQGEGLPQDDNDFIEALSLLYNT